MTEREWDNGTLPRRLLSGIRFKRSPRKRRLFACACSRRVLGLSEDRRCSRAVEVAEQFADGLITDAQRETAYEQVRNIGIEVIGLTANVGSPLYKAWKVADAAAHAVARNRTTDAADDALLTAA
jgi:hypothetical protein